MPTKTQKEAIVIPLCEICTTREVQVTKQGNMSKRCKHCGDRYDSLGRVFILYKTTYEFRSKKGLHHLLWFYEDKLIDPPAGFEEYVGMSGGAVIAALENWELKLVNIQSPVLV